MDLIFVLVLSLITIPVAELTEGIARIVLGVLTLLVAPGYSLTAALFPKKGSMPAVERAGLTLVMSFALVSLSGLALNYLPWGIRLVPIIVTTEIIILVCLGVAYWRRARLPEEERFVFQVNFRGLTWKNDSRLDRALYVALAVVVIGALTTLGFVIAHAKNVESFSNFYLLGPEGKMENYPGKLALGQAANVTLGIENHENSAEDYHVDVVLNGETVDTLGGISLSQEQKWLEDVSVVPKTAGQNQKAEFQLYKGDAPEPYLMLRLWLDVTK